MAQAMIVALVVRVHLVHWGRSSCCAASCCALRDVNVLLHAAPVLQHQMMAGNVQDDKSPVAYVNAYMLARLVVGLKVLHVIRGMPLAPATDNSLRAQVMAHKKAVRCHRCTVLAEQQVPAWVCQVQGAACSCIGKHIAFARCS